MNFHQTHQLLKTILQSFPSASLVTEDGKLLASSDRGTLKSTTSRLVVLQIIRKYLNPQVGDLFILNDPENGGLSFPNIFFVTRLTEKIYLVFVSEITHIQFKIPPTPLYDRGLKNKTIWPFLVDQNPQATALSAFFEASWNAVYSLKALSHFLGELSTLKNQNTYFKTVSQILEKNFNSNALGQSEVVLKLENNDAIKLRLTVDEKQNQRTIHADFSQTSPAKKISAASHIVESALVTAIAENYMMSELISQPVLDLIRLTLPPQSIVAKPQSLGVYNLYLQKSISEQAKFLLTNLTRKNKSPNVSFKLSTEFQCEMIFASTTYPIVADHKRFVFSGLDYLIQKQKLEPMISQVIEGKIHLKLKILTAESLTVRPKLSLAPIDFLFHNGKAVELCEDKVFQQGDVIELKWALIK